MIPAKEIVRERRTHGLSVKRASKRAILKVGMKSQHQRVNVTVAKVQAGRQFNVGAAGCFNLGVD
jgi:hypothetical protein